MKPLSQTTGPGQTPGPQGAEDPWIEHLGWVRRLALRLARDEAGADDLVQRTALVALRRREAVLAAQAGGGVRGWLRRVLYHEAQSGWRRDGARRARETDYASASAAGGEGPEDALCRAEGSLEFSKRLIAAMEELDEPHREVVVARYFHGQSIAEMSVSVGAPTRTVETRLRRARIKMRESLGRGDLQGGSSVGSWAQVVLVTFGGRDLGGLVGAAGAVPGGRSAGQSATAKAAATNSVAAKSGAGWLTGMMAMNLKVALGCSLALVAGLVGVLQWAGPDSAIPAPDAVPTAEPAAPGPDLATIAARSGRSPRGEAAEPLLQGPSPADEDASFVTLIEALPPGTLDVWVVDGASRPVVGAQVLVAEGMVFTGWAPPKVGEDTPRQTRSVGPDPREPVRFEGLSEGRQFVQVTSPSGAKRVESVELDPKYGSTAIVRFGSTKVFGRVTDEAGTPIQGAYLILGHKRPLDELTDEQRAVGRSIVWAVEDASDIYVITDENGEYSFSDAPAGKSSLVLDGTVTDWSTGTQLEIPTRYLSFELAPGEQRRVDFPPSVPSGGADWRGRVVDVLGNPVVTPDYTSRRAVLRVATWGSEVPEAVADGQALGHARGEADFDLRAQYALDGSFELRLPPGRYDAWISSPHLETWHHVLEAKDLLLGPGETVTRDLVLPGITLRGETDSALWNDLEAWTQAKTYGSESVELSARPAGVTHSAGILRGGVEASGAFSLYGLEPGEWTLTALRGKAFTELTIPGGVKEVSTVLLVK